MADTQIDLEKLADKALERLEKFRTERRDTISSYVKCRKSYEMGFELERLAQKYGLQIVVFSKVGWFSKTVYYAVGGEESALLKFRTNLLQFLEAINEKIDKE